MRIYALSLFLFRLIYCYLYFHRIDFGLNTSATMYPQAIAAVIPPAAALIPPRTASKKPSFAPSIAPFASVYPNPGSGTFAPLCAN